MLVNALRAIVKMEVSLIQDRSSLLQSGFIQIQAPLHLHLSFKLGCKQMAFHVCVKQKRVELWLYSCLLDELWSIHTVWINLPAVFMHCYTSIHALLEL